MEIDQIKPQTIDHYKILNATLRKIYKNIDSGVGSIEPHVGLIYNYYGTLCLLITRGNQLHVQYIQSMFSNPKYFRAREFLVVMTELMGKLNRISGANKLTHVTFGFLNPKLERVMKAWIAQQRKKFDNGK